MPHQNGGRSTFGGHPRLASLRGSALALAVLLAAVGAAPADLGRQGEGGPSLSRAEEPVVLSGASLPALIGTPVTDIALFRYDDVAGDYVPIPFQVDERFAKVFSPGELVEFTQVIHDVLGEDDGLFDDLDEIALLYGDTGPKAPVNVAWPAGSDVARLEVAVDDTRPGVGAPQRFVYVHTGGGLARSPTGYVYARLPATPSSGTPRGARSPWRSARSAATRTPRISRPRKSSTAASSERPGVVGAAFAGSLFSVP